MDEMMEVDLKALVRGIFKRWWIIVLCAVLAAAVSLAYTVNYITPTYKTSVTLYVNNNSDNSQTVSSSNLAVALQLVKTYVNIIKSDTVLEKVVEQTGLNLQVGQIRQMMSADVVDETEMFKVSVVSPNAQMSADIANAIASIAPAEISKIIEGSSAKVVDYAKVPTRPSSPSYTVNTILGGATGAALALVLIVVFMLCDHRVRNENDLIRICQVPVLGSIPDFTETAKHAERIGDKKERRKA